MLYLSRKKDESIRINDDIIIKIESITGKTVKLGIEFPAGVSVLRQELYDKIKQASNAAVAGALLFKEKVNDNKK